MSTNKHTPGPWVHWPEGGHGFGIITDEKYARHLAVIVNGAPGTEANARLIAAAPCLLSALQGALKDAESLAALYHEDQSATAEETAILARIETYRAAIQKAQS